MTTGRSGQTHCGSWTPRTPRGYWTTRVVCSREPNHEGQHRNPDGYEWTGDETPTRPMEAS